MRKPLLLFFLASVAGACDLQVRSYRAPGVPEALLGEWRGSWTSSGQQGGGTITVNVQEFALAPVVSVELDNPCIVPRPYELLIQGAVIEMRADGEVVLRAELGAERTMAGSYHCPQDSGTWSADWRGELPTIVDLAGRWIGMVQGAGGELDDLELDLVQRAEGGSVVVQGAVRLPTRMPLAVPVDGEVTFREDGYDLELSTTLGILPALHMVGSGDPDTMTIDAGVMQVGGSTLIPFASGVWTATQTQ